MVSVSKPNETKWFRFRPKPPGFAKPTNETIFKPKTTFFKESEIILSFYLTNLAKNTTEYNFFSPLLFIVHFLNYQGKIYLENIALNWVLASVSVSVLVSQNPLGFGFGFDRNQKSGFPR